MKSDVGIRIRKTTRQYRVVGWRQCSFLSVTKCDADTPENVLVSTDMSAVPAEVVVAKTSIEESSLQWRFVRQCHVDEGHEHIFQCATKCDAGNRKNSHANRWSFLSPSRGHANVTVDIERFRCAEARFQISSEQFQGRRDSHE